MIAQFGTYIIDQIQEKDAWKICNFMVANENRLKRYFPKTLSQNLTPTLSEFYVQKKVKQFSLKEEFVFTLKHSETRELVGIVKIQDIDWIKNQGELAYCIGYSFEGKGITSKAVKSISHYAFEKLDFKTLQIVVFKSNIGSVKIAEHNNFKWIKTLENEFTPVGESALDMELYELYNER